MHWTAAPAVPLARLSTTATATSRRTRLVDGDLHLHGVGAEHGLGLRPLALGQQVDERLVGVRRRVGVADLVRGDAVEQGRLDGGEDAARHRHEERA